MLAYSLERKV